MRKRRVKVKIFWINKALSAQILKLNEVAPKKQKA